MIIFKCTKKQQQECVTVPVIYWRPIHCVRHFSLLLRFLRNFFITPLISFQQRGKLLLLCRRSWNRFKRKAHALEYVGASPTVCIFCPCSYCGKSTPLLMENDISSTLIGGVYMRVWQIDKCAGLRLILSKRRIERYPVWQGHGAGLIPATRIWRDWAVGGSLVRCLK